MNTTKVQNIVSNLPLFQDEYNQSQLRAISTAGKIARLPREHARVCLLQGPPGTGKSHTIVGIIKHLVKVGFSIIISYLSNHSDNFVLKS